jgi:hypothetical protein
VAILADSTEIRPNLNSQMIPAMEIGMSRLQLGVLEKAVG